MAPSVTGEALVRVTAKPYDRTFVSIPLSFPLLCARPPRGARGRLVSVIEVCVSALHRRRPSCSWDNDAQIVDQTLTSLRRMARPAEKARDLLLIARMAVIGETHER